MVFVLAVFILSYNTLEEKGDKHYDKKQKSKNSSYDYFVNF